MYAPSLYFNGRVYLLTQRKAIGKLSKSFNVFGSLLVAFLIIVAAASGLSLIEQSVIRTQEIARYFHNDVQTLQFVQPAVKLWPADNRLYLGNLA